jgi:hypothetical protein
MNSFLKTQVCMALCLILSQLATHAQFTTTSPTNYRLRFDNDGNLLLRGFVFDRIDNLDLRNATWAFSPPVSLSFRSPLFVDFRMPLRVWEVDGSLFLQGTFYTNQSSLPADGIAFKNSAGLKVAVLTPEADFYLLGGVIRDASCTAPVFNPSKWNDNMDVTLNNNCYNYCNDKITMTFAQPGQASHQNRNNDTPEEIKQNAIEDGLVWMGEDNPGDCPNGHLVVCFMIPGGDWHWWRKDSDGTWSHKMAKDPATNLDNSEPPHIITDPENNCDRGGYDLKVGYFCTCGDNANIR